MKVLKFGGTSVGSVQGLKNIASIIKREISKTPISVVVSAMAKTTDQLEEIGNLAKRGKPEYKKIIAQIKSYHDQMVYELLGEKSLNQLTAFFNQITDIADGIYKIREFSAQTHDRLLGLGELISSTFLQELFLRNNIESHWVDSRDMIKTDNSFSNAVVDIGKTTKNLKKCFREKRPLYLFQGFISSNGQNIPTTLGRGGSDYTAALIASISEAEELQIWTDVSGMMTADPRWIKSARVISQITYKEASELSHFGAGIIYYPSLFPVREKNISVVIKNTFSPEDKGTIIFDECKTINENHITGVSSIKEIVLITLEGKNLKEFSRYVKKFFECLHREEVEAIFSTQASSAKSICIGIASKDEQKTLKSLSEEFKYDIKHSKLNPLRIEKKLSVIALIGTQMKSRSGISGRMFQSLGRNGINVVAIAQGSSEMNITAIVNKKDMIKGLNVLHEEFFESHSKKINVLVIGSGNVGSNFLDQIYNQQEFLLKNRKLLIKVVAIASSKKMLVETEGIPLDNWRSLLEDAREMDLQKFVKKTIDLNLRNSVFVDNTASAKVASFYELFLSHSISIVTCNKISASASQERYSRLKNLARDNNVEFLFETNVGAALPIIDTINNLISSGDTIVKIEAVLSGTLNFIFNEYKADKTFLEVIHKAKEIGFSEPDPRLDLNGTDVIRKILILARESGYEIEMEDVQHNSFLSEDYFEGNLESFYEKIKINEPYFSSLREEAEKQGKRLKIVAKFENGKASVSLDKVGEEHPFYRLDGKDNIVMLYTKRYDTQPLIIKGAGAGAEITASGVFADLIKTQMI